MTLLCDDPDEAEWQSLPPVRRLDQSVRLTSPPPRGWFVVLDLPKNPIPLMVGVWVTALHVLQDPDRGQPGEYRIVRDAENGGRMILVSPELREMAHDLVADFDSIMSNCDCGGHDCLAGLQQHRALQLFARRRWRQTPIPERVAALTMAEVPTRLAFKGPEVVDRIDDYSALMEIAGLA